MLNDKNLLLVSDGVSFSRSVSMFLSETFDCEQIFSKNPNTWNVKMRRNWWRSVCTGRFQQNLLNKVRYPYTQLVVSLIFLWTRTFRQIIHISVSCKIFALSSTYIKGKAVLLQAWTDPQVSRKLRSPNFLILAHVGLTHRPPFSKIT